MSDLTKRRTKVERLMRLAMADRNDVSVAKARFILNEIDKRMGEMRNQRINYINKIR